MLLGDLVDRLTIVNLKVWWAIEASKFEGESKDLPLEEAQRLAENAQQLRKLNGERSKLIAEINALQFGEPVDKEYKTY